MHYRLLWMSDTSHRSSSGDCLIHYSHVGGNSGLIWRNKDGSVVFSPSFKILRPRWSLIVGFISRHDRRLNPGQVSFLATFRYDWDERRLSAQDWDLSPNFWTTRVSWNHWAWLLGDLLLCHSWLFCTWTGDKHVTCASESHHNNLEKWKVLLLTGVTLR